MSSVYACMFCFFLAVLTPVSLAVGAAGSRGATGFSLPLVPNYHTAAGVLEELLPEGDAKGGVNITHIRPKMIPLMGPAYSVLVGIGSGETQHFYKLALDLVHPLTWMQCKPCTPEKKQDGSVFNTAVSPHYHSIASTDPRCTAPYTRVSHGRCTFDIKFQYHGSSSAHGVLSTDDFIFDNSGPGSHMSRVDGLVFGCAHTTHDFINHDVWAGVMSLNRHPTSFLRQLSDRGLVAGSRFSYCLVGEERRSRRAFLRFGTDVPDHSHARSTELLHGDLADGGGMYYVRLVGVSLSGRRLTAITPAMFERDPRSLRGGCTLDVGAAYTLMTTAAYNILETEVVAHLHRRGVHRVTVPWEKLTCFRGKWQSIRRHFPTMKLHFHPESAVLFIKPELLFVEMIHEHTDYACFAVRPYAERTVIGAGQMLDTRFTFDLHRNRLFFAQEQCHLDTSAVVAS